MSQKLILCLWAWIYIISLAACSNTTLSAFQGSTDEFLDGPEDEVTATGTSPGAVISPATLALPGSSELSKTPATVNFTPSPVLPTGTPTLASRVVVRACTPLAEHTLKDLYEILTNPFNPPPTGKDTGHHGVDFAYYRRGDRPSILGVTIQAVLGGQVAAAVNNRPPYGNMVIIETPLEMIPKEIASSLEIPSGSSVYLLYAHMNQAPILKIGEEVACGETLGEVGNTPQGWSSDPHLHLEGRIGPSGMRLSGMAYYTTSATIEEMDNYKLWRMSGVYVLIDPLVLLDVGLNDP